MKTFSCGENSVNSFIIKDREWDSQISMTESDYAEVLQCKNEWQKRQ